VARFLMMRFIRTWPLLPRAVIESGTELDVQMRDKWPKLTGIALGVCLALLIFSLLSVSGVLNAAALEFAISSFGLIFVFAFAIAIWLGWFGVSKGYVSALPLWGVLIAILIGWPLCAYGAVAARIFWMKRQALSEVPVMAEAQNTSVDVNWFEVDSPANTCFDYRIASSQQVVFDFYREQLSARGWAEDTKSQFALQAPPTTMWYLKTGSSMRIDYSYTRNQRIENQAPRFPNKVDVCYWPVWPY
jgi:hypothetical protein